MTRCAAHVALYALFAFAAVGPARADAGDWQIRTQAAVNGGSSAFIASVTSTASLHNTNGRMEKAAFAVSCSPQGLFVDVVWPDFISHEIGSDDAVAVTWRVDDRPSQTSRVPGTDQTAVWSGLNALGMLERISTGKVLTVHLQDQDGGQTASFPVKGALDLYNRIVSQGCGQR
jgi:hypothetical protein